MTTTIQTTATAIDPFPQYDTEKDASRTDVPGSVLFVALIQEGFILR